VSKSIAFNQDCLEAMRLMADNAFDLAIVDPPYGIETRGNAQDRFRMNMQLATVNDAKPSTVYFTELFRVSKNQIIWGYNHLSDLLPSCREFVFWYKRQPVVTFADGELAWTSFQKTAKCFEYSHTLASIENRGVKIHPTQKPIKLYKWLLINYAKTGDRILDTHLGSGSSRIAAYDLGFDFTGFELDRDYYEAQEERFARHTAQPKLFEPVKIAEKQESLFV
jgi:site-specific DNA-methyltransferase (adenine-specific)